ncbi:MAG: HAMP domain-containing protein, partial [Chloroflexota bacterium]
MNRSIVKSNVHTGSIQSKITLWTGLCLLVTVIILVSYSVITVRQESIASAEIQALAIAEAQSNNVKNKLEVPLFTARTMAESLAAVKDSANPVSFSRDQANAMLRKVLVENPTFLGTYTLWEPNAFDGQDAKFAGTAIHDETGRFIPYWIRGNDGSIQVTALIDYETPGIGDWYLIPRNTINEAAFLLTYPVQSQDVLMTSFIVPIVQNGKFYGIVGVDAPIRFAQQIVDGIDLYQGTANAVLFTDEGKLIAVRNRPELSDQPATNIFDNYADIKSRVATGKSFLKISPDGKNLQAFAPIQIGNTGKYWSFSLIIPYREITASATAVAVRQVVISAILIVIALLLLQFLARQIAYPIRELTLVANEVSQGRLNVIANVQTNDETGILASAFNQMTSQLSALIGSLEQRVEERTAELVLANERNERRAKQFESISLVARTISSTRDLDSLLAQIAEVINREFGFYHIGIFLLDTAGEYAVLSASNSDGGKRMLKRSHRLKVGETGIVGYVTGTGRPRIALNTGADAVFFNNPDLPETHSEIALPLHIADQIIGALDVQSIEPNAF